MIDVVLDAAAWKDVEPGTQALLDKWLVGEGDAVRAGQAVASVVLIKATLEIAAPADGVVASILVPEADNFGPGQPLARLRRA
jgi:pyruvate/2-oxoglutarate dehydrogenase complex dihydrolipoamide acyltransferase (E2) component